MHVHILQTDIKKQYKILKLFCRMLFFAWYVKTATTHAHKQHAEHTNIIYTDQNFVLIKHLIFDMYVHILNNAQ